MDADASPATPHPRSHKPAASPSARAAATAKDRPTARTDFHSSRAPPAIRRRHQQGQHHGDRENRRDRNAMLGDDIQLLHDTDTSRDKQQRQMREQASSGILHAVLLQRPARQNAEAVTRQQQQQQKQQADHRTRHRQRKTAHDDFARQLTQQDKTEACYHSTSAPETPASTDPGGRLSMSLDGPAARNRHLRICRLGKGQQFCRGPSDGIDKGRGLAALPVHVNAGELANRGDLAGFGVAHLVPEAERPITNLKQNAFDLDDIAGQQFALDTVAYQRGLAIRYRIEIGRRSGLPAEERPRRLGEGFSPSASCCTRCNIRRLSGSISTRHWRWQSCWHCIDRRRYACGPCRRFPWNISDRWRWGTSPVLPERQASRLRGPSAWLPRPSAPRARLV